MALPDEEVTMERKRRIERRSSADRLAERQRRGGSRQVPKTWEPFGWDPPGGFLHSRGDCRRRWLPRTIAELLIDCEEDRVLRAVLVGMLREYERL